MSKKILVDALYEKEVQVAIVEDKKLLDFEYLSSEKKTIKGNIYLAKVSRVEPSLQAAFIEYGGNKQGFIPLSEILPDYYNIPVKDRDALKEQALELRKQEEVTELNSRQEYEDKDFDEEVLTAQSQSKQVADNLSDEAYFDQIKQKTSGKYKIQEVIKRNQILLVQAIKEERGNKGATFTTYISLAGRSCVLMPSSGSFGGGVSRKITDFAERRRLKAIVDKITTASSASVIIRTIARGRSEEEIAADYHYLADLWNQIREKTLKSVAPVFIHAEDDMLKKLIRDMYGNDIGEIIIQGESTFLEAKKVAMALEGPEKINITEYKGSIPIFAKYGVAREIASLYSPVVNLQSGAYIVINHTEALIAIDVNSGKLTSEKNVEETAFKTNLEAATEIARQIKLRDLAGLIVIDFIDMIESSSRKHVERVMRDLLYSDKAKVQIGRISEFGLLEMTRQRLKPNFLEYNTVTCNHCRGKGVIRSYESSSINILKTLEMELSIGSNFSTLKLYAAPETVMHLLNYKKSELCALEQKYNTQIIVFQDARMSAEGFAVEKLKKNKMNNRPVQNVGQTHTDRPKNNSQNHQFIENNQRNSSKDNIQNTIVNKGHNQLKESQVNEAPEKKEEPNLVSKSELNEESSLKNEKSVDSIEISNNDEQEKVQSLSEFESIVNLDKAIKKKKYRKNRFKQKKHFRKTMENVPETKD